MLIKNFFYSLFLVTAISCAYDEANESEPADPCSSDITFSDSIQPIIASNCAISGCHDGSQSPTLRTYEEIFNKKDRIKARTANRSMPLGRTLTQVQIDEIECWVEQGAVNN